jgi:Domain of Unknown Function (DUF1080)
MRQYVRFVIFIMLIVGLVTSDAQAARRGLLGRVRGRRGGCASACAANTATDKSHIGMGSTSPDGSSSNEPPPPPDATAPKNPLTSPSDLPKSTEWRSIFDGETLTGWKSTPFGGEGEVKAEDGNLIMEMGQPLTGANYTGDIPRTNYEVQFDAMRVKGGDFFCGFTFPVKDTYCSFIVGGWAGGVVGLSSLDGQDASENETTKYMMFESNRWYKMRVRVTDKTIECWIDDKDIVYAKIEGRKVSTRIEVDRSQPFGFATYETTGALRNIRIRELSSDEIAAN